MTKFDLQLCWQKCFRIMRLGLAVESVHIAHQRQTSCQFRAVLPDYGKVPIVQENGKEFPLGTERTSTSEQIRCHKNDLS